MGSLAGVRIREPETIDILRHLLSGSVSFVALIAVEPNVLHVQSLQRSYSPAADIDGGSQASRADIIAFTDATSTFTGNYNLLGTSARRFVFDSDTIATRNQNGDVISGYDAAAGRSDVVLGTQQKTISTTYPDQIQGAPRNTGVRQRPVDPGGEHQHQNGYLCRHQCRFMATCGWPTSTIPP